ncbi:transposase [Leptolyngbya sp. 7M]|uniref:transposase n=1 Tax=Leptolyngbya sp. 7M TaxID=2812896 RepID=UPI001B8AB1FA|nr:transposase [Leptolyngbya sp. 7M]QYO67088.1 transposase [Leptolyngbya sp. 7M]
MSAISFHKVIQNIGAGGTIAIAFDVRASLYQLIGLDLTQIHGIGPYLSIRLISECGTDLSRWPSAKHFTSWLRLSPGSKKSGGKVLSSHTGKTTNRVTVHLRRATVAVGKTNTALGAFYRRLAARIGKAKAVTATARKLAVLFYNAVRYGMAYVDPGANHYEQQYRQRVVKNLHRKAAEFGFTLQPVMLFPAKESYAPPPPADAKIPSIRSEHMPR